MRSFLSDTESSNMLTEEENKRLQELDKKINDMFIYDKKGKITEAEIEEHYRLSKKRFSQVLLELELQKRK